MKKLQIDPKSYDTRLCVLCTVFVCKKFKKPTIIASSDPVVLQMAEVLQLPTCEPVDIANCGDLLGPAAYVAPKTPVVTPKPEPHRQSHHCAGARQGAEATNDLRRTNHGMGR
ncbi:hypothetical protein CUR178_07860 [Leishmania enriettii]|uniref:Uncharacterized protein n=1 Tax=Leishmania enriettii TaxID=5663 RepID=A0A836HVX1_LEIEN|nr:hypothetical protein CUR178_07860 [Leishmania enriettii]